MKLEKLKDGNGYKALAPEQQETSEASNVTEDTNEITENLDKMSFENASNESEGSSVDSDKDTTLKWPWLPVAWSMK